VSSVPVDLVDIMSTLRELIGRRSPPQVHGRSLVPRLTGQAAESPRTYSFSERIVPNQIST
jgi:arylsulfatase A-like enzyme